MSEALSLMLDPLSDMPQPLPTPKTVACKITEFQQVSIKEITPEIIRRQYAVKSIASPTHEGGTELRFLINEQNKLDVALDERSSKVAVQHSGSNSKVVEGEGRWGWVGQEWLNWKIRSRLTPADWGIENPLTLFMGSKLTEVVTLNGKTDEKSRLIIRIHERDMDATTKKGLLAAVDGHEWYNLLIKVGLQSEWNYTVQSLCELQLERFVKQSRKDLRALGAVRVDNVKGEIKHYWSDWTSKWEEELQELELGKDTSTNLDKEARAREARDANIVKCKNEISVNIQRIADTSTNALEDIKKIREDAEKAIRWLENGKQGPLDFDTPMKDTDMEDAQMNDADLPLNGSIVFDDNPQMDEANAPRSPTNSQTLPMTPVASSRSLVLQTTSGLSLDDLEPTSANIEELSKIADDEEEDDNPSPKKKLKRTKGKQ